MSLQRGRIARGKKKNGESQTENVISEWNFFEFKKLWKGSKSNESDA